MTSSDTAAGHNTSSADRAPFVKLADPAGYVAFPWDLSTDRELREHWVGFFRRHFDTILELGVAAAVARGESSEQARRRAAECRAVVMARFDAFEADPPSFGRVSMFTFDAWRDGALREHGFTDAFIDQKDRTNADALPLLGRVCRELDGLDGEAQLQAAIRGIFAGNIFDAGSEATAAGTIAGRSDFFAVRAGLPPRPWLVDDNDALADRLLRGRPHRKAIFFIDNAGSDFVLGAVPLARYLARRGTRVVLAANELPSLNDMTANDVRRWWPPLTAAEPSLAGLPIEVVSTGTGEPLIDLSAVSAKLNAAATDADLVILEGMGRAVESNFNARFTCDVLKIAMIKDTMAARLTGGKLYDLVCRWEEPSGCTTGFAGPGTSRSTCSTSAQGRLGDRRTIR